jgi:hypothetical protein
MADQIRVQMHTLDVGLAGLVVAELAAADMSANSSPLEATGATAFFASILENKSLAIIFTTPSLGPSMRSMVYVLTRMSSNASPT